MSTPTSTHVSPRASRPRTGRIPPAHADGRRPCALRCAGGRADDALDGGGRRAVLAHRHPRQRLSAVRACVRAPALPPLSPHRPMRFGAVGSATRSAGAYRASPLCGGGGAVRPRVATASGAAAGGRQVRRQLAGAQGSVRPRVRPQPAGPVRSASVGYTYCARREPQRLQWPIGESPNGLACGFASAVTVSCTTLTLAPLWHPSPTPYRERLAAPP